MDCLRADFVLSVNDPLGNCVAHGSRDWEVGILQHYPIKKFVTHLAFEGLVIANVDRLDKLRAASRDELNLHAKRLDGADNQPYLVDPKLAQEEDGDDARQHFCNIGGQVQSRMICSLNHAFSLRG